MIDFGSGMAPQPAAPADYREAATIYKMHQMLENILKRLENIEEILDIIPVESKNDLP